MTKIYTETFLVSSRLHYVLNRFLYFYLGQGEIDSLVLNQYFENNVKMYYSFIYIHKKKT